MKIRSGVFPDCVCGENAWLSIRPHLSHIRKPTFICIKCDAYAWHFEESYVCRAIFLQYRKGATPGSEKEKHYLHCHIEAIWEDFKRRVFVLVRERGKVAIQALLQELDLPMDYQHRSPDDFPKEKTWEFARRYCHVWYPLNDVITEEFLDEPKLAQLPAGLVGHLGIDEPMPQIGSGLRPPTKWQQVSHADLATVELPTHPHRAASEECLQPAMAHAQAQGRNLAFEESTNLYKPKLTSVVPWYKAERNDFTLVIGLRKNSFALILGRAEPFDFTELSKLAERDKAMLIVTQRDDGQHPARGGWWPHRVEVRHTGGREFSDHLLAAAKIIG